MKYILSILSIVLLSSCTDDNLKAVTPVKSASPKTEVVSHIVEITPDLSKIPSYCDPKKYLIKKMGNKYYAVFPGGTIINWYPSAELAQDEINKEASKSYKIWVESGGLEF